MATFHAVETYDINPFVKKYVTLTTDEEIGGGLPPQEGQAGKYLTTDGTQPSWEDVSGGISIPTITISSEQVITAEPLTVQFTEEQDAIIIGDAKFINIDATALGTGVTTFIKEEANIDGDYMLISPTADYDSSILTPETPTTQAIAYRHSIMIGVHKVLRIEGEAELRQLLINMGGVSDLPTFDTNTYYFAGQYVLYNNYVYRFIASHPAGAWIGTDAVQTSVFGELKNTIIGDVEQLHINLSSSDGELDVEGLQVQLSFDDGGATQMLTVDADGNVTVNVTKGRTFTLSVADQTGYQHISMYKSVALSNIKYVYFVYEKEISGDTCTVTVRLVPSGAREEQLAGFVGKTVNLILSDGTSRSAITDSNYTATFLNVKKGVSGYTHNPKVTNFITPAAREFNTNFDTVGIDLVYAAITVPGIWMVRDDGAEFDYASWDTSDTLVALHIATQVLADDGNDFYVPIEEFKNEWFVSTHSKQWSTDNILFPNVNIYNAASPYYNGKEATQNMMLDASTLGINAPAAEFAIENYFTLKGITVPGFIGTREQYQVVLDNWNFIKQMLSLVNISPVWTSAGKGFTTSSQATTNSEWRLGEGSWMTTQFNTFKTTAKVIVPLFSL